MFFFFFFKHTAVLDGLYVLKAMDGKWEASEKCYPSFAEGIAMRVPSGVDVTDLLISISWGRRPHCCYLQKNALYFSCLT